jgi:hypothetical protein
MNIFILNILNEYYFNNVDYFNELYMVENKTNIDSNTSSNTDVKTNINISNSAGDSAIIAASMAAGAQLAKRLLLLDKKHFYFLALLQ